MVRWDPRNAWVLCRNCHQAVDTSALEKYRLIQKTIGDGIAEQLLEKSRQVAGFKEPDKREMITHFKSEYARIRELREQGVTDNIEVQIWL